jgi:hypothetical protein
VDRRTDGDGHAHAGRCLVRVAATVVWKHLTMIIMVLVAGYLLTRRATDFAKAEPKSPLPTTDQRTAAQWARPNEPR